MNKNGEVLYMSLFYRFHFLQKGMAESDFFSHLWKKIEFATFTLINYRYTVCHFSSAIQIAGFYNQWRVFSSFIFIAIPRAGNH